MADSHVRLKLLLRQRRWQSYPTFKAEYDRAARKIDPKLVGTAPSRAQLHRWLTDNLKGLPYGDHCRILEAMFPGWSAEQLFESISEDQLGSPRVTGGTAPSSTMPSLNGGRTHDVELITSGGDLTAALLSVPNGAQSYLAAVGSRSREPAYLQAIERVLEERPALEHYRILIGPPRSQVLKDHLLRLMALRPDDATKNPRTLHISILDDPTQHYERFFVVNERTAVIMLPSGNSPVNFDTGLLVRDPTYARGLFQHALALYGRHRLESIEAINGLEALE